MNKDNKKYLLWTEDDKEFIAYKGRDNYIFPSYESVIRVIREIETSINEDYNYSDRKPSKYTIYELGNIINVQTQLEGKPKISIKMIR